MPTSPQEHSRISLAALAAFLISASSLAYQQERPTVFVVQKNAAQLFGQEANDLPMVKVVAQAFSDDGRLQVVSWDKSDIKFREATNDLILPDEPTDELISDVARRVKGRYIMVVEATRFEGKLFPRADLYETGKRGALWTTGPRKSKDGYSQIIKIGDQPDWDATANSLARTWVLLLAQGPLKSLGLGGTVLPNPLKTDIGPKAQRLEINASAGSEAIGMAEELVKRGQAATAIVYLKDAVDANPFEPERRLRLMELLSQQGLPAQAADEGRRAARLQPDKPELWLLSAKSWLLADRPDDAQLDVQEALARGVDSALAHRLQGDIALIRSDLAKARDEYSVSLEKEDAVSTRLGLSISFALIGQASLSQAILAKEPPVSGPLSERHYAFAIEILTPITQGVAKRLADAMPQLRAGTNKASVAKQVQEDAAKAKAITELLQALRPPDAHVESHQTRVLAHKLMHQASEEALSFAAGGDPDAGLEVVLSLGEALRQLGAARDQYQSERQLGG